MKLGNPSRSTDTCSSSRSPSPRWPRPSKPMSLELTMRPSVAHSLFRSRQTSCESNLFFCFAGRYFFRQELGHPSQWAEHLFQQQQSQTSTARAFRTHASVPFKVFREQTPVPAAGVPVLVGPSLPSCCLWKHTTRLWMPQAPRPSMPQ